MTMPEDTKKQQHISPQRSWLKRILWSVLGTFIVLFFALAVMFSTDKGSQFLLDRVLKNQSMMTYEYDSGSFLSGLILKSLNIHLTDLDVNMKHVNVVIGWRAILNKEVHFYKANIQQLQIVNHKPPTNTPFDFAVINMPVTLRLDHASVDRLELKTTTSSTEIKNIILNNTLWQNTQLSFRNTSLSIADQVFVKKAKGQMDFQQKYPLHVTAQVDLPSLHAINIKDIFVDARGTLDALATGFAVSTPDLLTGRMLLHPVRDNVPMQGQLNFNQYHWPIAPEQKLFTSSGIARLHGSASEMNVDLSTDLQGTDVPKGQYRSQLNVDYLHQLNIKQFTGQLMGGSLDLNGTLNWDKALAWNVKGQIKDLKATEKSIPQQIQPYLPPIMNGKLGATGSLEQGLHLNAFVDLDKYEKIKVQLDQGVSKDPKLSAPLNVMLHWNNMNRQFPSIGWLNSPQGEANVRLLNQDVELSASAQVLQHAQSMLPEGQYQTKATLKNNHVDVSELKFVTPQGGLTGHAQLDVPTEKQQLKWAAQLVAKNFNPQTVSVSAPIDVLNGEIHANGYAKNNDQFIQLDRIDLTGKLAQQKETVHLTGQSTTAVLMHDEKQGGGLKGYGVVYDGKLQSSQYQSADGLLSFKISGTPNSVEINRFQHDGVAGKILANGKVNFAQGIAWDMNASLIRFKPQYFSSAIRGEVSGVVNTTGVWVDKAQRISINDLNLAGTINNQVLRGKGKLNLVMNTKDKTLIPKQFEANDLFLAYAGNQAQVTGNAQKLQLKLNAPYLNRIYTGLRGRAYGVVDMQTEPTLQAIANINIDRFGFGDQLNIEKIRVRGELPTSETTPTKLQAEIDQLNYGQRQIQYGAVTISGTPKAHVVSVQGWNKYSKLYVQLNGGFNQNHDWLGQIQQGNFDSLRASLKQQQNANVVYKSANQSLYVSEHCWASNQSQLCFDQPVEASPQKGNISFIANRLNLSDFAAFMPDGLAMTGEVNGYAKANWEKGKSPHLDAKIMAQNGRIGMTSDDPDDGATTTSYQQMSLLARSVAEGLQLRFDVKTQNIGNGYASVIIDPYKDQLPMQGEAAFSQVDLQFLKPFIPDARRIGGTLDFAAKINGTVSKPLITGDLRLKDGLISMISTPVNLNNIQMYSAIRQDQATIMGIFNSGPGLGKIDGQVSWRDEPYVKLKLQGENLLVKQAPLITALVNTEMNVDLYPNQRSVTVKGNITVPRAIINMPETSPDVINVSADARVVRGGEDLTAILKAAKPWNVQADIDFSLGDRVIFQGFNSRIPLTGRLYLSQRGLETAMSANGAIGISQKVKIESYGQTLDLNRAIARFNGPLANPTLDIDTTKKISNTTLGVRITGTASTPNIQIYNDGGLSEQEALNALLTGRINQGSSSLSQTEGFKSDVNNTLAAAGLSLGLGGTRAFTNQLGHAFGLSGLALDAQGTGDDTQVSVTGYITPDLYLRYGMGVFTAVNKLTLRYQMNKRLYLEASESVERAVDVFYNWRF
ncbi:translocation/assembly module TamB domain-containing protein [Acinetobacter sp. B10A]|uniref:translocation/assembly module TamB domain-containing protein n=1 Tax=Acinetobacter baretiae TaxID=2605383 RepID=UPI001B3C9840|nr:translocation/assembly module TamB domain-containing protein [Acinetobacter baretiae]MBF7685197.1 translocation/assembly module TamB domain-containing protein [Acinetobacter baretiae]